MKQAILDFNLNHIETQIEEIKNQCKPSPWVNSPQEIDHIKLAIAGIEGAVQNLRKQGADNDKERTSKAS